MPTCQLLFSQKILYKHFRAVSIPVKRAPFRENLIFYYRAGRLNARNFFKNFLKWLTAIYNAKSEFLYRTVIKINLRVIMAVKLRYHERSSRNH